MVLCVSKKVFVTAIVLFVTIIIIYLSWSLQFFSIQESINDKDVQESNNNNDNGTQVSNNNDKCVQENSSNDVQESNSNDLQESNDNDKDVAQVINSSLLILSPKCNGLKPLRDPDGNPFLGPRFFEVQGPERPLKIFHWHYWCSECGDLDWIELSNAENLCPYPPELEIFFERLFEKFVKPSTPNLDSWPKGYAPCYFWTGFIKNPGQRACNNGQQYIWSLNYTDWNDIDIIFIDIRFWWLTQDDPPFYDKRQLPPQPSKQLWWLYFASESLDYYPYAGPENFREMFSLSIGSPAKLFDLNQPSYPVKENKIPSFYETHVPLEEKRNDVLIAWLAGNCQPRNNRNDLVQNLTNIITVHSYGSCLHNMDFPKEILDKYHLDPSGHLGHFHKNMNKIKLDLLRPYKFVLALENSNCEGYVTEKVYHPMLIDAIPVYLGAPDVDNYVPPHSIIKVSDYETVEELVAYIKKVANDPILFASYFAWKNDTSHKNFCKNCREHTESMTCRMLKRVKWI